jgi:hypothetical protein
MKYFSTFSDGSLEAPFRIYWVKAEEVYEVQGETEADFIIRSPEKFYLTVEDIQLLFDYCGEETNHQEEVKLHLMRIAESHGWIRIQRQTEPLVQWSIKCDNPVAREKEIKQFLRWAIDSRIMTSDSKAVISGSEVQEDFQEYIWKDCIIEKYLET